MIGQLLGPYRVLAKLGEGGMGVVYRAHDTRLGRDVAVKVLPPDALGKAAPDIGSGSARSGAERRARFEREARAVAALTHPNVCTLHDVGHDGDIEYLVMELVEGTTLSARLAGGPMPPAEALACAIQVADGLAAAHRLGIVHRDLKPGNIMLTRGRPGEPEGLRAKLLDFGLARLRADQDGVLGGQDTTAALTGQGQIVGTLHYMAPEQLEGRPVDARADVFAFGAILHEMLTGRRAFDGVSPASVIGAIFHAPVPAVSQLVPLAPPALDRLVSVCLAKDPADRWSSAHDVLLQLRAITLPHAPADAPGPPGTGARATTAPTGPAPVPARSRPWRWALAVVATAALGAAGGGWLASGGAGPAPDDTIVDRLSVLAPEGSSLTRGEAPQISPDGRRIAFVASDEAGRSVLHVREREGLASRALPGTDGASMPFWAPDGQRLGFFASGRLKTVALAGGAPQELAAAPVPRGGSWGRNDMILFVATPSEPPRLVPAAGGPVTPVRMPQGPSTARLHPLLLPDGRHYLYLTTKGVRDRLPFAVQLGSIDAPETRTVVETTASAAYAPGHLLFRRGLALMAQPFDETTLALRGEPRRVADDAGYNAITYQGLFSAAAGVLVYQSSAPSSQLAWVDRDGHRLSVASAPADYSSVCLTAGDDRLVYDVADPDTGAVDVWSIGAGGGTPTRLTFDRAVDFYPACGPGGRDIAFASLRDGAPNIYRLDIEAPGSERLVLGSPAPKIPSDWSADGTQIVFSVLNRETGWDVGVVAASGGEPALPVRGPADERNGRLSPDGRWLAYASNETGTWEIYVQPFPGAGAKWQVSKGGGTQPRWRRDGRELYYLSESGRLAAVAVSTAGARFSAGATRALFRSRVTGREATQFSQYDVTRDGTRFVLSTDADAVLPVTVVRNWPALLARP